VNNTSYPIALKKLADFYSKDFIITDLKINSESKAYNACRFVANGMQLAFRSSKITPKKIGQFVSIWKRDSAGFTQPFVDSTILIC